MGGGRGGRHALAALRHSAGGVKEEHLVDGAGGAWWLLLCVWGGLVAR